MTATEKPTSSRSKSNELRLADGEIAHIGVDVHKANYHVAVVSGGGNGRVALGIAQPGLPQIRTCPLKASGSSSHDNAALRARP